MAFDLRELEGVLRDRLAEHPDSSYSVSLMSDGELAQRKLMEEAFELCLELGRERRDDRRVVEEATDLLFHVVAALVGAGLGVDEVLSELERRRG